jgi:hypothetical protein
MLGIEEGRYKCPGNMQRVKTGESNQIHSPTSTSSSVVSRITMKLVTK